MSEGYRPDPIDGPSRRPRGPHSEHYASIPLYLLLTIATFFLFNLYWNYKQMLACNDLLERREFGFLSWLILSVITCGLYHLYYQYRMGDAINEIQDRFDLPISEGLPILSVVAALLGFGMVADCIHQHAINQIVTR